MSKFLTIGGLILAVCAAGIYIWSDYTPNGKLGSVLEIVSYVVLGIGAAMLIASFAGVGGNKK